MAEFLTLYKPDRSEQFEVQVLSREPIGVSSNSATKIVGSINELDSFRSIHLVSKKPQLVTFHPDFGLNFENEDEEIRRYGEAYYDTWYRLKKTGISTIDDMWLSSPEEVVMTDITTDGSWLYDKADLEMLINGRASKPTDPVFASLNTVNLISAARRELDLASRNRISLNNDDPFAVLVNPNAQWKVVALDLEWTEFEDPYASSNNQRNLLTFQQQMESIKRTLITIGSK